eukprot:Pompholyxophrys_sp_v1_NODE_71_length_2433_cov_27.899117.p1 type:complete len:348 gc:universal NODE_71_length_2433_cov_27.899117:1230-2273(+)
MEECVVPKSAFEEIFNQHAPPAVRLHAVYASEVLNIPQKVVGHIFGKSAATICRWVHEFKTFGKFTSRKGTVGKRKVLQVHREWIISHINQNPLDFLHEISKKFFSNFNFSLSLNTFFTVLKEAGYSKKVIERRAMEISKLEIARFTHEFNSLRVKFDQLLFLDEMSMDNRSMIRKKGWFPRGERPVYRSFFKRGIRISLLCFLGVDGIVECVSEPGTFNRKNFFNHCISLLDSGKINLFPGKYSVWILDGARIHVDVDMVNYFRSRGIIILYLPSYCPFYNPIEIVFGLVKRECRQMYKETKQNDQLITLMSAICKFSKYCCSNIFNKCGYDERGFFNPLRNHEII